MRQLPQTNFEEKLSLVYEKMTNSPSRVLKEYSHENAEDVEDEDVEDVEDVEGEENAEEDSVRRYIEDELVYAFEGDRVMDLGEFIELGKIVLRRPDVANMNLKDFVSTVGDEIGMELEVSGDEVMLVDYKDSGEENAEDAEDAGGGTGDFSIRNELFNLHSNLDQEARTRSGSLVSEELKTIIDELDDIVRRAEQFGSKFDLIKQLRLD